MSVIRFRVGTIGGPFDPQKEDGNLKASQEDDSSLKPLPVVKSFEFVGGISCKEAGADASRRVKQHLMRDYMQRKRCRGHARFNNRQTLPWTRRWVEPGDFPKPPVPGNEIPPPLFTPPGCLGSPSLKALNPIVDKSKQSEGFLGSVPWNRRITGNTAATPCRPNTQRQTHQPLFTPTEPSTSAVHQTGHLVSKKKSRTKGPSGVTWEEDPKLPRQVPRELVDLLPGAASPKTFLGAGRVDPFQVYPFECGPVEHQILDFHYNRMGEITHGLGPRAPLCYFRLSVNDSLQDGAILHLVLAFASYRWATMVGGSPMHENTALAHKIKGLKIVNERISDPDRASQDFNIQAALIMSGIEGRAGNFEGWKSHVRGIRSMVHLRGGLAALSPVILWQICSMELRLMDKLSIEHMPYSDKSFTSFMQSQSQIHHPPHSLRFFDPLELPQQLYLHACVYEFLAMISQFRKLSAARNNYNMKSPSIASLRYPSAECITVASTFRSSSPLHTILLPSRLLPNLNANAAAASVYEQDTTRLACLFYIHSTLWSYRNEPFRTDGYVAHIASQTVRNSLDRSGSVEGLSWVLLWMCLSERDEGVDDGLERTRLVLRLMRVARKLDQGSWKLLERALFDALVGVGEDGGQGEWIMEKTVWDEVMGEGRYRGFICS